MVRCDRRGIAIQSAEIHRHLRPHKTLCALYGPDFTPYDERPEAFPGAVVARYDGHAGRFPDDVLEWFTTDVDCLLAVETFGDWRIVRRARALGIGTVVHTNPEFALWFREPTFPAPTISACPTMWRLDSMPGAIHLPMPASDRLAFRRRTEAGRFVHVVGHRAMRDRAGTDLLVDALWQVRPPVEVVVRTRKPLQGHAARMVPHIPGLEVVVDDVEDFADLYAGADVLVHPRKYGGLSLTLQEAMALGLAVVAADRVPERDMLPASALIPLTARRPMHTQVGRISMDLADPRALGQKLGELAANPDLVESLSAASGSWAAEHSWERLLPTWRAVLEQAANREQIGVRV
jgi:glycosyl transferase family 1